MAEHTGWLLDVYDDRRAGAALWLLGDDGTRRCFSQFFPVTFYAAGNPARLRMLWRWLEGQSPPPTLRREERRDLFEPQPVPVLAVQVSTPARQETLFQAAARLFPDLTWYDADLALPLRHAARWGTFPLARLRLDATPQGIVQELEVQSSPWEVDPSPAPLRILQMEPDDDPSHAHPRLLHLRWQGGDCTLKLDPPRPLLVNLAALLRRLDPDLLLADWGDTWLLPWLLAQAGALGLPLPLSRDPERIPLYRKERSYMAYGQVVHRGQQVMLYGRWHLDCYNSLLYGDYDLEGVLETARVTSQPVQQAARLSPGSGISAMQIVTALRGKILVPWRKQQVEQPRTALDLLHADQGGLVYQPICGLHAHVAELDFISMYPSIMTSFNISPETNGDIKADPGLIPTTLSPLLKKRVALKNQMAALPPGDLRRKLFKSRMTAHKWLLVTCFGYLGYKNARFGRIEAHQEVTAWSRECLLLAKEAAEDAGFIVLHMYVDGIWIQRPDGSPPGDLQPLMEEIRARTGLSIGLEGVYRWVAFLPSRVDARVPVPNRYFGVFTDGSIKVRGLEARRHDSPPWVTGVQMHVLEILARAPSVADLPVYVARAQAYIRAELRRLQHGRVPVTDLVLRQKLSRVVSEYRTPSPAARAALQLETAGKPPLRAGQYVRFVFTRGRPGVCAWDLPDRPDPRTIDLERYAVLLRRAVDSVLGCMPRIKEENTPLELSFTGVISPSRQVHFSVVEVSRGTKKDLPPAGKRGWFLPVPLPAGGHSQHTHPPGQVLQFPLPEPGG